MIRSISVFLSLSVILLVASCSTEYRLRKLDSDANSLLTTAQRIVRGENAPLEEIRIDNYHSWEEEQAAREAAAEAQLKETLCSEAAPPASPSSGGQGTAAQVAGLKINLRQALELAARHSRDYQNAREELYDTALSLRAAQHLWDWNPTNNIQSIFSVKQNPSSTTFSNNASIGFGKRLLSGGRLVGSFAIGTLRYLSGTHKLTMSTLASLALTQPLLAGAGATVAREGLTQAERNLVYSMRNYLRVREELLISIAQLYYNVLNAEANLKIGTQRYASLKYSRERSEAMSEGGRVTQIDVDQAKQRQLNAESNLVSYRQAIESAKNALKLKLGLPIGLAVDLETKDMDVLATMTLPHLDITLQAAIDKALAQRLDFATVKDRLEDTERAIRIAKNAMLAKVDFSASASAASPSKNRLSMPRLGDATYELGLDIDLPFDRMNETIALKRAYIKHTRQQRVIAESRDAIIQNLQDTWESLAAYEQKIKIQKMSIALAMKRVENTRMLFEDGRIAIREYLDAQDDLSDAQNTIAQQLVSHRMTWLQLLYQMEELDVDPDTLWTERLEVSQNP